MTAEGSFNRALLSSRSTDKTARPLSLCSLIDARKYVFIRLMAEKLRSALAEDTGKHRIGLCTQELGHFGAIHCHCIKRFMIEIVCNLNNALWW